MRPVRWLPPFSRFHFGFRALGLVLLGSFARLELASACQALSLTCGKFSHFCSLPFPSTLGSRAPFPCKTPLLLLGPVGLAATQLEIEEGKIALSV